MGGGGYGFSSREEIFFSYLLYPRDFILQQAGENIFFQEPRDIERQLKGIHEFLCMM